MNKAKRLLRIKSELKENLIEVETADKGYTPFSRSEIEFFLGSIKSGNEQLWMSDDLPKWLYTAVIGDIPSKGNKQFVAKETVKKILQDVLDGNINNIYFNRDVNKSIIGLGNIDIKCYL